MWCRDASWVFVFFLKANVAQVGSLMYPCIKWSPLPFLCNKKALRLGQVWFLVIMGRRVFRSVELLSHTRPEEGKVPSSQSLFQSTPAGTQWRLTFLLWAGGGEVLILYFHRRPIALHPAEKGAPGARTQPRWARGDVCLHWKASWKKKQRPVPWVSGATTTPKQRRRWRPGGGTDQQCLILLFRNYFLLRCYRFSVNVRWDRSRSHGALTLGVDEPLSWGRVWRRKLLFNLGNVLGV